MCRKHNCFQFKHNKQLKSTSEERKSYNIPKAMVLKRKKNKTKNFKALLPLPHMLQMRLGFHCRQQSCLIEDRSFLKIATMAAINDTEHFAHYKYTCTWNLSFTNDRSCTPISRKTLSFILPFNRPYLSDLGQLDSAASDPISFETVNDDEEQHIMEAVYFIISTVD